MTQPIEMSGAGFYGSREHILPQFVTTQRYYPGGNETLLVTTPVPSVFYPEVARRLLAQVPSAEQVGYIVFSENQQELPRLHMAGGEFCGNATRSFLHYLHRDAEFNNASGQYSVIVSGVDGSLSGAVDGDLITLNMPLPPNLDSIEPQSPNTFVVKLPGISHVVILGGQFESRTMAEAMLILQKYELLNQEAAGVIYVGDSNGIKMMNPFVHVREVGSLFNETSCASGATAAGIVLALEIKGDISLPIRQRSGDDLTVSVGLSEGKLQFASISGKVQHIETGYFALG